MQVGRRGLMVLIPVIVLGACSPLSDQDRALLTSASRNAEQAKTAAQQAVAAAQAAQASAAQAEADAKAADDKAAGMDQGALRK